MHPFGEDPTNPKHRCLDQRLVQQLRSVKVWPEASSKDSDISLLMERFGRLLHMPGHVAPSQEFTSQVRSGTYLEWVDGVAEVEYVQKAAKRDALVQPRRAESQSGRSEEGLLTNDDREVDNMSFMSRDEPFDKEDKEYLPSSSFETSAESSDAADLMEDRSGRGLGRLSWSSEAPHARP
ncbi:hypothetical protein LTR37_018508 [Vermiconidia calcicola]|uniref:Uncharacterized protein n=1 Tax=Vermiconidia calcicola TaxID=1690605 RepID=A0ACC3MGU5_9PEZI|nr:hypothetical protein LTR37_018508 [Vermiconidia calcicola]